MAGPHGYHRLGLKNSKTTPCTVARKGTWPSLACAIPQRQLDSSGKSGAIFHYSEIVRTRTHLAPASGRQHRATSPSAPPPLVSPSRHDLALQSPAHATASHPPQPAWRGWPAGNRRLAGHGLPAAGFARRNFSRILPSLRAKDVTNAGARRKNESRGGPVFACDATGRLATPRRCFAEGRWRGSSDGLHSTAGACTERGETGRICGPLPRVSPWRPASAQPTRTVCPTAIRTADVRR